FTYDGTPDIEKFDKWIYEVETYYGLLGVDMTSETAIRCISSFIDGKAARFFQVNVRDSIKEWTIARFQRELFTYCFPATFIADQKDKFDALHQGTWKVKDYISKLEAIAQRIPYMTDRMKVIRFWEGANSYLQVELTHMGHTKETSTLDELESACTLLERA
ncbi:hypothetical protein BOTBODRAFT_78481, partial [Botryobasidium botryosum FD-172 SS1]